MSAPSRVWKSALLFIIGTTIGCVPALLLLQLASVAHVTLAGSAAISIGTAFLCLGYCIAFVYISRFIRDTASDHHITDPVIVDTSAIIDGRIVDVAKTGIIRGTLIIPDFVLSELQCVADSSEAHKRMRGRRGLDMLKLLEGAKMVNVKILPCRQHADEPVDARIIRLAKSHRAGILTTDFNLEKVASIQGLRVLNLNHLANALKAVVLPGESLRIKLIKPGEEPGQGVAYLEDGTMVVVEQGRDYIGQTVSIHVTSNLQTNAGRMIFAKIEKSP